jgi:HEAT repeat protein
MIEGESLRFVACRSNENQSRVTMRTFALLFVIGGIVTATAYGQGPLEQNRGLADPSGRLDPVIAQVTQRLRDEDAAVRQAAAVALRDMGPKAKAAIPALAELLRDRDGFVVLDASRTLEKMGLEAVPSLVQLLSDPDPHVRELAARTLGRIEPEAKAAIPALTQRLRDEDSVVRHAAVVALREMGSKAKTAIPALAESLRDEDRFVRIDAFQALVKMGPEAMPSVTGLLHDADRGTRELALQTLQQIEADGRP